MTDVISLSPRPARTTIYMWKSRCTFMYMHCCNRLIQDPFSLNRTLSLPQWRGAGGCGEFVLNVDEEVFQRTFERLDAANSEPLKRFFNNGS
jgi:hypothetical protein